MSKNDIKQPAKPCLPTTKCDAAINQKQVNPLILLALTRRRLYPH